MGGPVSADLRFPAGFLLGAATSSHQVEGGNRWNDWWEGEQDGRLPHKSGDACRHYELYEEDFDLAHRWGHNAHRFSIEWSRCEPEAGTWNQREIEHYQAVVAALGRRGIEPIVTLHHFTNPEWFARRGGWLRGDSVKLFSRYVEKVSQSLGDSVRYWITTNEPTVFLKRAFLNGRWPPFQNSWIKATLVLRNLVRAHRSAYRVLHRHWPECRVGLSHSSPLIQPCNAERSGDRAAAWLRDLALNRTLLHLASGGRRYLDFIGINYYTRTIVRRGTGSARAMLFGQECDADHHTDRGPVSTCGWEVYPAGLLTTLHRLKTLGLPLLITENGLATDDEELRNSFLIDHLRAVARALADGVPVLGYFYWSLLDNFEWDLGMEPRFGLAAVDAQTQQRHPRPAADIFSEICRDHQARSDSSR